MSGSFRLSLLMRGLIVMVIGVLLLAAGAGASPRNANDKRSTLQAQMDMLVATGVPGVVVLVHGKNGTLRLASGRSDLARKTSMRVTDRFRVGSITKSFIATVVLQLAGEGKLSLDDTVDHWLPGAVPNGKTITLRQLLGHRSGLYDYLSDPRVLKPYLAGNFGYTWTPRRLVAVSAAHKPLFAPGTKYLLLEHQLHPARPDRREGDRQPDRCRAEAADLRAAGAAGLPRWTPRRVSGPRSRTATSFGGRSSRT